MAGDSLSIAWKVVSKDDKPKHNGGVVTLTGRCTNQNGTEVANAEAKMLVANNA
jgi:acyl dehydratase